jgi:hypothetical protein
MKIAKTLRRVLPPPENLHITPSTATLTETKSGADDLKKRSRSFTVILLCEGVCGRFGFASALGLLSHISACGGLAAATWFGSMMREQQLCAKVRRQGMVSAIQLESLILAQNERWRQA